MDINHISHVKRTPRPLVDQRARWFPLLSHSTAAACWCDQIRVICEISLPFGTLCQRLIICLVERVTVQICNPLVFIALLERPADAVSAGGRRAGEQAGGVSIHICAKKPSRRSCWARTPSARSHYQTYNGTLIVECRFKFKIGDWSHTSTEYQVLTMLIDGYERY